MSQIVFRVFGTAAQAETARRKLNDLGLGRMTTVVSPPANGDESARPHLATALQKAGLRIARAQPLASRILAGDTVIVVNAPFGFAMPAITAMEDAGALVIGPPDPGERYIAVGEIAALFSEMLSLPVLAQPGPILSSSLGLPTLLSGGKPTGFGNLIGTKAKSYTGFLGLPLLAGTRSTRYTGFLGLPLLAGGDGPYKGFLGLPLLTKKS